MNDIIQLFSLIEHSAFINIEERINFISTIRFNQITKEHIEKLIESAIYTLSTFL